MLDWEHPVCTWYPPFDLEGKVYTLRQKRENWNWSLAGTKSQQGGVCSGDVLHCRAIIVNSDVLYISE